MQMKEERKDWRELYAWGKKEIAKMKEAEKTLRETEGRVP